VHGWQFNTNLIEFADRAGSFRNTTINGSINGMELHLGVIDDPVKGRAEAQGKGNRDKIWHWFTDDWGARFAKDASRLIIMTRWHVDDLLGRFIEHWRAFRRGAGWIRSTPAPAPSIAWRADRGRPLTWVGSTRLRTRVTGSARHTGQ
jgi:hypothetical protein